MATIDQPSSNFHLLLFKAEVPIDEIGRRLVQPFCHTKTGGFLLFLLESGNCNTSSLSIISRASPVSFGNCNTFSQQETNNANSESVKEILIGQRILESDKWKL
jgi:hypothetical protein